MHQYANKKNWYKSLIQIFNSIAFCIFAAACTESAVPIVKANVPKNSGGLTSGEYVVGNLGGMKSKIPIHIPHHLEYDNESVWNQTIKPNDTPRNYESIIRSFAFYVRYPDMATMSDAANKKDFHDNEKETYAKENSEKGVFWIRVGVGGGASYPGDGFMNRYRNAVLAEHKDASIDTGHWQRWWDDYVEQKEKVYGLTQYVVRGFNPVEEKPTQWLIDKVSARGYTPEALKSTLEASYRTQFVEVSSDGDWLTHIDCSYRGFQPCTQYWSMESHGVRLQINVFYLMPMLRHWRQIKEKIDPFILGFRVQS